MQKVMLLRALGREVAQPHNEVADHGTGGMGLHLAVLMKRPVTFQGLCL